MRSRLSPWCLLLLAACGDAPVSAVAEPAVAAPEAPVVEELDAGPADAGARDANVGEADTYVGFLGRDDRGWRTRLATVGWERMERGSGGRSLGFRVTLADGSSGYFKPEQAFAGARWYAEVAAYHVDRALGLGKVPPSVVRSFPMRALEHAATDVEGPDPRLAGLHPDGDGRVRGAFIGWIDGRLTRWRLGRDFESQLRQRGRPLVHSPFQPPRDWRAVLSGRVLPEETDHGREPEASELGDEGRAEVSDLVLFDTLIHNVDRWGGDYTNIRRVGRGGPLIYLDNAAAFWEGEPLLGLAGARLRAVERFRRSTVMAIETLDLAALRARIAADGLEPMVRDERHWEGLETRRRHILRHVQHMHARYGESVWVGD